MSCLMTKPTKWALRPAKTQISLSCPGWSEFSLGAQIILLVLSWGALSPNFDKTPSLTQGQKLNLQYSYLFPLFNNSIVPMTVVREDRSVYVNNRHPKTSTSIHSTLVTSVTGIVSLPLLPTLRPSRDSGKASPACLPHSYFPTRQSATCT